MWALAPHPSHVHHVVWGVPAACIEWVPGVFALSNVIISYCAKILAKPIESLQKDFEKRALLASSQLSLKQDLSFLEYCFFKALASIHHNANCLKDKQFRRLTFDMMIAWETPETLAVCLKKHQAAKNIPEKMDRSYRYMPDATLISLLAQQKNVVTRKAFMHIAPAIPGVADILSAHFQFNALARPTGGYLPFSIYNKYLKELDKALEDIKDQTKLLNLDKWEIFVELEGTLTNGLVILHVGASAWPGRLILTSTHLYFEYVGVVSCLSRQRWGLTGDQHVEPQCIGPRSFFLSDKALSQNSPDGNAIFEFPGVFGHLRREYWLMIIQEIIYAHHFIRKSSLSSAAVMEVISRSVMSILRLKATREALRACPARPRLLLAFSAMHELSDGNVILKILEDNLSREVLSDPKHAAFLEKGIRYARSSAYPLFAVLNSNSNNGTGIHHTTLEVGEFFLDDLARVKTAMEQSLSIWNPMKDTEILPYGENLDRLSINVAVIKAAIGSLQPAVQCIDDLLSWNEPVKTISIIVLGSSIIVRNLIRYVVALLFLGMAMFLLFFKQAGDGPRSIVNISSPTTEEELKLEHVISELEEILKRSNIVLLKMRSLFYSACPEATYHAVWFLVIAAALLTIIPAKIMFLLLYLELFTRRLPLRQENSAKFTRKLKEWWSHIPIARMHIRKSKSTMRRKHMHPQLGSV
ncbi:hypothetical protein KP509_24G028100 [Ceratopteris richardii]|uniref:Uncharacterized protein n=1 Tax=Ceratopteris richardii TaxID=49495 RepID=A0A8T2RVW3_CERRI|nr:hypothetical protein KP509_24G028100 [Ceratopteris richardii]